MNVRYSVMPVNRTSLISNRIRLKEHEKKRRELEMHDHR